MKKLEIGKMAKLGDPTESKIYGDDFVKFGQTKTWLTLTMVLEAVIQLGRNLGD